jgi:hypothetical protein
MSGGAQIDHMDEESGKPPIVEEIGVLEGQETVNGPYVPTSFEELRELFRPTEQE